MSLWRSVWIANVANPAQKADAYLSPFSYSNLSLSRKNGAFVYSALETHGYIISYLGEKRRRNFLSREMDLGKETIEDVFDKIVVFFSFF